MTMLARTMIAVSRFYYEFYQGSYRIYDRKWSNTVPIGTALDVDVAEMICTGLNQLWERPH